MVGGRLNTSHRKDAPVQGNTTLTALTHVTAAKGGSNPLMSLLPLVLIVVVFYFLLIRPQRKRQQQQAQLQNQIVPGQRVMTTAGMLATVVAVEDDAIVLEIAPGVEARFVKQAVGQVLDDSSDEDEEEETDEAEEIGEEQAAEEPKAGVDAEVAQDDIEPKTDAQTVSDDKKTAETLKDGEHKADKKPSA
jgi:preprotein translocase subunit YajC